MNVLRKGHRLKVYENKVLRRLSGCNREEMTVGWRMHYEGIHSFFLPYVIRIIIKVNEVFMTYSTCTREINAYGVLMRIPEGKRPLGGA
jgi:hypothetical protein